MSAPASQDEAPPPVAGPASSDRALARRLDGAGLGLALALAAWATVGADDVGGARRGPVVALVAAAVVAAAAGRWLRERWVTLPPALVAGVVGLSLVSNLRELDHPVGDPLGYANANATFGSLGVLGAVGVVLLVPAGSARWRGHWIGGAGVLALLVLVPESLAGAAILVVAAGLVAVGLGLRGRPRPELAVLGGGLVVALALGLTVVVALGANPAGVGDRSAARGDLWAGAVELVEHHPVRGIGPGAFADHNPVTDDPDLRWAHHGYLQAAAELGLPGLVMVLALVAGAYVRLVTAARAQPAPAVPAVVGAAALTAVALHATVDYVLHLAAVPLTLAFLFGWATGSTGAPSRSGSRDPDVAPDGWSRNEGT